MPHPASSLPLLRRAASRGFQLRIAAVSGHRAEMPLRLNGSISRPRLRSRQQQQLPGCSPISRPTLTAVPESRRSLAGATTTVTMAQPASAAGTPTSSSSSSSAALLAAAAAVATAAGSGLGRLGSTSTTAAAAPAAAAAAATSASTTTTSPAPPLEGTPVPWASLGPSLDLIQQRFRVGSSTFRLLAPRDVDAVMDMYLDKGLLDADPYWTRAWPSAIALAATVLSRPELVAGKVVADLGAGLGLAGMAAAIAGAREVVLLDREPAALQCALLSAAATGLDSDLPDLYPESDQDPDLGPLRRRRVVEPLPADQLPPYAALQLTPGYRHLLPQEQEQQQQGQGQQQQGQGDEAAGADGEGHRQQQQQREREWAVLMALAKSLRREPPPGQRRPAPAPAGSSAQALNPQGVHEEGGSGDRGGAVGAVGEPASTSEDPREEPHLSSSPCWSPEHGIGSCAGSSSSNSSSSNSSNCSGIANSSGSSSASVLRAHVFDWTAPPDMARLLPPPPPQQQQREQPGPGRGRSKGGGVVRQRRFDVVLACDVLYEDAAVGPISGLMPLLLEPDGGRLLLADPPNRTVRNRERFLEELRGGPLRLAVEECSLQQCEVSKLDNEMAGGLAPTAETVPVQFLVFRSSLGNDTVGLKL
ncbi:hypothetical protein PLESTM_001936200 [Pleodorina starrii]|nr:hypothetical protein PLESTM_001936200 [Pleodorina starrii]